MKFWNYFTKKVNVRLFVCSVLGRTSWLKQSNVARSLATMAAVQEVAENVPAIRPLTARSSTNEYSEISVRLQRCRQHKLRTAAQRWERIPFTNKKLFTVVQAHNHQNHRIWSAKDSSTLAVVEYHQNDISLTVWNGICSSGKSPSFHRSRGENKPSSLPPRHSRGRYFSLCSAASRRCKFGVSTALGTGLQNKNDARPILHSSSRLRNDRPTRRTSVRWTQQRVFHFGGQGLCYVPQNLGGAEAIAALEIG